MNTTNKLMKDILVRMLSDKVSNWARIAKRIGNKPEDLFSGSGVYVLNDKLNRERQIPLNSKTK